MARTVMLWATVCVRCIEDCCVEGHSVGGCGDGGCYQERVYVNNVVGGVLGRLNECYYRTIGLFSLRT